LHDDELAMAIERGSGMDEQNNTNNNTSTTTSVAQSPRSGLRLIVSNKPQGLKGHSSGPVDPQEATTPPAPKNPLVTFMSAYADAIDRDVEMILGL